MKKAKVKNLCEGRKCTISKIKIKWKILAVIRPHDSSCPPLNSKTADKIKKKVFEELDLPVNGYDVYNPPQGTCLKGCRCVLNRKRAPEEVHTEEVEIFKITIDGWTYTVYVLIERVGSIWSGVCVPVK